MTGNDKKTEDFKTMGLGDHLEELRYRLLMAVIGVGVGFAVCLYFGKELLGLLVKPYIKVVVAAGLAPQLQAIQLSEQFLVYVRTSLVFGLILSAPWIFYHFWKFVSAGLYSNERRFIYAAVPASAVLFVAGAAFFVLVVAPWVMAFFIKFDTGIDFVKIVPTLQSYTGFVLSLTLIFAAAFQMPIAVVSAERMGLISVADLVRTRKFVILGLLIISAIVTPPDVISQIALTVPLYALFEVSILICRLLDRGKRTE